MNDKRRKGASLHIQSVNDINCQNYTIDISRHNEQKSLIHFFSIPYGIFIFVSKTNMFLELIVVYFLFII